MDPLCSESQIIDFFVHNSSIWILGKENYAKYSLNDKKNLDAINIENKYEKYFYFKISIILSKFLWLDIIDSRGDNQNQSYPKARQFSRKSRY